MKYFKNLKVSQKLLLIVLPAFIALLSLLVIFITSSISIHNQEKKLLYTELYTSSDLILNADRDFYQAYVSELKVHLSNPSLSGDALNSELSDFKENTGQVNERIHDALTNLSKNKTLYSSYSMPGKTDTLSSLLASFDSSYKEWASSYDIATDSGDFTKHEEQFSTTREYINSMTDLVNAYAQKEMKALDDSLNQRLITATTAIIVVILIISFLAFLIMRFLRVNIEHITKDMKQLAENDLTFKPLFINSSDELGVLSSSVISMVESLKHMLSLLQNSSKKLTTTSTSMSKSSGEVTEAVDEIANTISEIARGAMTQASDSEKVVSAITDLGEVISRNSQSSKKLSVASEEIEKNSKDGLAVIQNLLDITQRNQDALLDIFQTIQKTNEKAEKIGEASELIAAIAEQTNLLSLNAAIEAARAGEAGKGFSVVAQEIRKLSEESTKSTNFIDSILVDLQTNVSQANDQSSKIKQFIEDQSQSVHDTKAKYLSIADNISKINHEISQLNTISSQIESSRASIADITSNLSAIAQENAASTQEASASSEEILASMTTMAEISIDMNELSIELEDLIHEFKLES